MKKLCKSNDNRIICGVCAGIADYVNLDVTVVRLAFAALALVSIGVPLYIVAAIIMPQE